MSSAEKQKVQKGTKQKFENLSETVSSLNGPAAERRKKERVSQLSYQGGVEQDQQGSHGSRSPKYLPSDSSQKQFVNPQSKHVNQKTEIVKPDFKNMIQLYATYKKFT